MKHRNENISSSWTIRKKTKTRIVIETLVGTTSSGDLSGSMKKKEFEDKSIRRKAEKYVWAEAIREAPRLMIGALAMAVSSYSNQGW